MRFSDKREKGLDTVGGFKFEAQCSCVIDETHLTVWRRKPQESVIIHSDHCSQFCSDEFNRWCKENRLSPSMSRRGNCCDNAVAESFFSNLKSEKIKNRIYQTRAEAKSDIFDYIEVFYNRVLLHKHFDQLSLTCPLPAVPA